MWGLPPGFCLCPATHPSHTSQQWSGHCHTSLAKKDRGSGVHSFSASSSGRDVEGEKQHCPPQVPRGTDRQLLVSSFTEVWFLANLSGFGHVPVPLSFTRVPFVFLSRMPYSSRRENYIKCWLGILRCGGGGLKHKASMFIPIWQPREVPGSQLAVTHNPHAQLPVQAVE